MSVEGRDPRDAGAATVLLVALMAALLVAVGLALQVVHVGVARARITAAADLAALAAARAADCAAASPVGLANGATRLSCEPRGSDFLVRAETDVVVLGDRHITISGLARAGPPG
jgi:secretion/DNA translocation related TadE-like protein